ncbi:tubulin-specific chaperone cofactor E-like protein [Coccinella septempunctata]|uniref:tubulin-specific chaperone cofactor E-like protein n=1 Tax=Coccinella septempunctata TaxID=41139 RepID=UPI001D07C74F|nr:tubulin-specific chaperone cofactor E-like protein [Coccinella septempunctata]
MTSLLEALEQKYGEREMAFEDLDDSKYEDIAISIFVPCRSPRALVPSLLVLNDCDITTAGDREALVAKCSCVEELDLAKNKLHDWPEVFCILQQMPRLKFVNLSFNELSTPINKIDLYWEQLRNLVLNSTFIRWESIQEILGHLPQLEELHLSLNDYKHVHLFREEDDCDCQAEERATKNHETNCCCPKFDYRGKHSHTKLRKLHFTGNPVREWWQVCKLGYAFPNLESLVLANCPIDSLKIDVSRCSCDKKCRSMNSQEAFKKLEILNLNSTDLSGWDDVETLAKFPALNCVRVQGCPLWESNEYTEHERRQLFIARLPNVNTLNGGGKIGHDEREDAERAFIRYYMEKPECERPDRYFELVSIHGKLDPLVNIDLRPEKRVKVLFTCGNNSEIRSVDVYRTVSDLKLKLEAFAGFSASKMRLFYVDQDLRDIQGPEEMKYPHKQLYSYNIYSGDEIIIDYKGRSSERNSLSQSI